MAEAFKDYQTKGINSKENSLGKEALWSLVTGGTRMTLFHLLPQLYQQVTDMKYWQSTMKLMRRIYRKKPHQLYMLKPQKEGLSSSSGWYSTGRYQVSTSSHDFRGWTCGTENFLSPSWKLTINMVKLFFAGDAAWLKASWFVLHLDIALHRSS